MTAAELIQTIRQRCGDVNAISPAAEEHLARILQTMANSTMVLFAAAASTRTAQKAFLATLSDDAQQTAAAAEQALDDCLAEMAVQIGYGLRQQSNLN
jgi:alpha-galactosidase/6-phospho-beta-glucosidase family protein